MASDADEADGILDHIFDIALWSRSASSGVGLLGAKGPKRHSREVGDPTVSEPLCRVLEPEHAAFDAVSIRPSRRDF